MRVPIAFVSSLGSRWIVCMDDIRKIVDRDGKVFIYLKEREDPYEIKATYAEAVDALSKSSIQFNQPRGAIQ